MEVAEQKKLKVPKLRFREFDGGWKMNRIDSIFTIFNGYAFSSLDATTDGCRWVKIADVGINEMRSDSPSFLPVQFRDNHPKYVLHQGDYVIALTRPILGGKLKIAQINEQYDGALLNQRVGRVDSTNDKGFVYAILQRHSIVSRMESRIAGSDPPNLSPNEIGSLRTHIPTLPEQQKIAGFLSAVDEKLQHLNRKKELLQQYKKGVMQKLFPSALGFVGLQDDRIENDPDQNPKINESNKSQFRQLRFKREDGSDYEDWEEKRLGEVAEIQGGGTPDTTKPEYWDGGIPWYTPTEIVSRRTNGSKRTISELGLKDSSASLLPVGAILFTSRATIGAMSFASEECTTNQGFMSLVAKPDAINAFLYYWISMNQKVFIRKSQGSTFLEISKTEMRKIPVTVPCKEEQQKIADFLSSLDEKIDAVSAQIGLTQQFKKGLLQEMFV